MPLNTLLRRSTMVFATVATGAGLVVFFFNGWFHEVFLPGVGLSQPIGDAVGAMLIVAVAYIGQRLVSLAFFKDGMLGMSTRQSELEHASENVGAVADEVAQELRVVPTYNDVLRKQLDSVVQQTEKAAYDITERLQAIDEVVGRLGAFVAESSAESNEMAHASEARIAANQSLIADMRKYISFRIEETQADQVRVGQVVKEARSLESLTRLIKDIAAQTNLLALNAAIEAARAGEAGRGFAVVADEVRKLSAETEKAVVLINQGILSVASTIETQLQEKLSSVNLESEQAALGQFADQLSELGHSYEEILVHQGHVIDTVRTSSEALATMFMSALASVQFQDVTRQQIEHTSDSLTRLDGHLGVLAERLGQSEEPDFSYIPLSQHLDEIYSNYVMDQQRHTHHTALHETENESGGQSAKIELF
ncbi:MAG: chemotaxis protein [Azoarcus sp.]|nr:MAG: chemotaxis protein [Azoarcus sp.]TVT58988.1 MAG: chemotaxis protein [Azoarcus sp. PHD]